MIACTVSRHQRGEVRKDLKPKSSTDRLTPTLYFYRENGRYLKPLRACIRKDVRQIELASKQ